MLAWRGWITTLPAVDPGSLCPYGYHKNKTNFYNKNKELAMANEKSQNDQDVFLTMCAKAKRR